MREAGGRPVTHRAERVASQMSFHGAMTRRGIQLELCTMRCFTFTERGLTAKRVLPQPPLLKGQFLLAAPTRTRLEYWRHLTLWHHLSTAHHATKASARLALAG